MQSEVAFKAAAKAGGRRKKTVPAGIERQKEGGKVGQIRI
jgi:hypothetical protein